jgi:hypothetical protein
VCGTYYDYETTYEFLIGGSEDEERLDRLTPTEARRFYSAEEYAGRIEAMEADIGAADPTTREYAARSLAAHYLLRQEVASVERLLRDPDVAVAGGALRYLHRERYRDGAPAQAPEWEPLVPALEALHRHEDDAISLLAGAVLYRLGKIDRRAIRRT